MILDVDGERAPARLERNALGHRPGGERAVALEPEVVVEPPRLVALDDEERPLPPTSIREGLGRSCGVALSPVGLEVGHQAAAARSRPVENPVDTVENLALAVERARAPQA
jgi:hypothetical protein